MTAASFLPLDQVPAEAIEQVLDNAFGPDRRSRTAYLIRSGMEWLGALSFAALDEGGELVATIQAWPVALTDPDGRAHPLLMVGPVAVQPRDQGRGFGRALVTAQLGAIAAIPGEPLPQVLIGDPEYYGLFGFSADYTVGWRAPGPFEARRLLARAANPAVLPRQGMLGPWRG